MSDIFTRPLPKVTFEYLQKNSKNVPRSRDGINAEEHREHHGDSDEDTPSVLVGFGAPKTYDMSNDRSSAADVQGFNLECIDKDSDDTVMRTAIFVPEDRRAYEICNLDDSTKPADTNRGVPLRYLDCNVERDVVEQCKVDASDIRPIWAFKLKRYPDGHINKAKARFCIKEKRSSSLTCLMRPPKII